MIEWTDEEMERYVSGRLDQAGLVGSAFDRDAIVADLRVRLALDSELDELIGPTDPEGDVDRIAAVGDDEPFDPLQP
jgi:hypothetical protein